MRLLFNASLAPALVELLQDAYLDSVHTASIRLFAPTRRFGTARVHMG